eukprot:169884-Chlamydomonas_euryale.AAC.1
MAVPVTPGKKSTAEQFAGALYTTTVEAFIPETGKAIQVWRRVFILGWAGRGGEGQWLGALHTTKESFLSPGEAQGKAGGCGAGCGSGVDTWERRQGRAAWAR